MIDPRGYAKLKKLANRLTVYIIKDRYLLDIRQTGSQ